MNTSVIVAPDKLTQAASTLQKEMNSPNSKLARAGDVLAFRQWLSDQGITRADDISYDVMLDYKDYLLARYAKATAARKFISARRLLAVAVKSRLIDSNPAVDVEMKVSVDDSVAHIALLEYEQHKLLEAVEATDSKGKRDLALLMVLLYTGLRRSEIAHARIVDVIKQRGHYVLVVPHGKGNKRRSVPMKPEIYQAIWTYLDAAGRLNDDPQSPLFTGYRKGSTPTGLALSDRQIHRIVAYYADKAGIKASPHDIRASFITNLIETGKPVLQVQRLAGHASPTTTERYYSRKQDLDESPVYLVDVYIPGKR